MDFHITLGNLVTLGGVLVGLYIQTRKLGLWQGKVDQVLEMLSKDYYQRRRSDRPSGDRTS